MKREPWPHVLSDVQRKPGKRGRAGSGARDRGGTGGRTSRGSPENVGVRIRVRVIVSVPDSGHERVDFDPDRELDCDRDTDCDPEPDTVK